VSLFIPTTELTWVLTRLFWLLKFELIRPNSILFVFGKRVDSAQLVLFWKIELAQKLAQFEIIPQKSS